MIQEQTWVRFGEMLDVRFSKEIFTTEDSVRYTFFAALMEQQHIVPEDVWLEYPHPAIPKARVDTWLPYIETGGVALEFKYHRSTNDSTEARPMLAGMIFADTGRLGMIRTLPHCVFVYVVSGQMRNYLMKKRNKLHEFLELPLGHSMEINDDFMSGKPATFLKSAGATPNVTITRLCCMISDFGLLVLK